MEFSKYNNYNLSKQGKETYMVLGFCIPVKSGKILILIRWEVRYSYCNPYGNQQKTRQQKNIAGKSFGPEAKLPVRTPSTHIGATCVQLLVPLLTPASYKSGPPWLHSLSQPPANPDLPGSHSWPQPPVNPDLPGPTPDSSLLRIQTWRINRQF